MCDLLMRGLQCALRIVDLLMRGYTMCFADIWFIDERLYNVLCGHLIYWWEVIQCALRIFDLLMRGYTIYLSDMWFFNERIQCACKICNLLMSGYNVLVGYVKY